LEFIIIFFGAILILAGIAGSILPLLPGPPLGYLGLLVLQLLDPGPFTMRFLLIMAAITLVATLFDYLVPVLGSKKSGATKLGVWGSVVGLVIGIFAFPPIGIIVGPFLGALVGEMISGKDFSEALRSGFGSFMGFLAGTIIKLILSLVMAYYFVMALL
jgi:uncharacterized protein